MKKATALLLWGAINGLWFIAITLSIASAILGAFKNPWFFLLIIPFGTIALWALMREDQIETSSRPSGGVFLTQKKGYQPFFSRPFLAASCSASCLLFPFPSATLFSPIKTATVNCLS